MSNLKQTSSILTDGAASPTDKYDHEITLVDHTRPAEEPALSPQDTDAEPETPLSPSAARPGLAPSWPTRASLRRELTRRKYARWQEDRMVEQERPAMRKRGSTGISEEPPPPPETDSSIEPSQATESGGESSALPKAARSKREHIRHHKNKVKDQVKDAVRGPRLKHKHTTAETVYDVLYENERGAFFCGIPRFSSKSLLNFDPAPWQTSTFRPSPVNITNAQVPDPSWRWADGWTNWHVDMSFGEREPIAKVGSDGKVIARARGDTDEEGWRYSFAFGQRGRFAWHGTHPWFHSFVRRRRWVRLRIKRVGQAALEGSKDTRLAHDGHLMNAEYFTIHNSTRPDSRYEEGLTPNERAGSKRSSIALSKRWSSNGDEEDRTSVWEIGDIPGLLRSLRRATVDRQKVAEIRNFLDHGSEELYYLAVNMEEIVSLLIFQDSRQQLLALLTRRLREAQAQDEDDARAKHKERSTDDEQNEEKSRKARIANLQRAVDAAEAQCKRLAYWSDTQLDGMAPSHEVDDHCDETEDENEAPIGETTVFRDGADDEQADNREVTDDARDAPGSAPDRPEGRQEPTLEVEGEEPEVVGGDVFVLAPEPEDDSEPERTEERRT